MAVKVLQLSQRVQGSVGLIVNANAGRTLAVSGAAVPDPIDPIWQRTEDTIARERSWGSTADTIAETVNWGSTDQPVI